MNTQRLDPNFQLDIFEKADLYSMLKEAKPVNGFYLTIDMLGFNPRPQNQESEQLYRLYNCKEKGRSN
ncbi:MAG: hypothetical protein PHF86_03975 [Candidatus Nanoarchaeia archaeon]|nr:hypothetical protein [Candidatus Nanoarchaeia archaeon]